VVELRESAQRQAARVQGDLGRVGFHDEDVVDVGACCGEGEGSCYVPGELGDTSRRNTGAVQREIVCCGELSGCSGDGGTVTEVEVAGGVSVSFVLTRTVDIAGVVFFWGRRLQTCGL
jgi:hypothetical protein